MMDRLGQQLGNYRLTRLLGQGGFAEVYQGEHLLLGTTVAIKVLHTKVGQEEVAHFQQEARLLASLKHPHIVRVFDFGIDGQTPYLIMDYASHGTLRTRHARGTRLPLSTVVEYITQMAEALQYAHERKVVHRDVKPENMLIGEQDNLLLSDFGIALIAQSSRYQSTQQVIGTAAYMSPEQIRGKPRAASDQYALGIVVYEWLSGTHPFEGSFIELCTQHLLAPPPSLCEKVPTLSREVEEVVLTTLAKDPKERFKSVRAFATALQQACQGTLPTEYLPSAEISSVSTALFSSPTAATMLASPSRQPADSSIPSTAPSYPATEIQTPPTLPDLPRSPMPARATDRPAVSRRAVLIGASGAVIVAGGAGLFALLQQHHQGQLFFTYRHHSGSVRAVAWSPDGERIASGSYDNTVQVWNASDGSYRFTYQGHSDVVSTVAWSPDGKRIASGSYDNTVQVWNASDGSHLFTYKGHLSLVLSVAWSPPDGKWIASGSDDRQVQVWNPNDGNLDDSYGVHNEGVSTVAWSPPDGKWIASGSYDNTVQVWTPNHANNGFTYNRHSSAVLSVAWSPNGQRIASGSGDKTVQVWNASDGSHAFIYHGHSDGVLSVAWSPNGQRIASCSDDRQVQVWQAV